MKLLLIEDNQKLAQSVKKGLAQEGYAAYDLLILDIMLPGKDGVAICMAARSLPYSFLHLSFIKKMYHSSII